MRRYYFENVSLTAEQKLQCHNALCILATQDLVSLFSKAVKAAHQAATPRITSRYFWENLFVGEPPLEKATKKRNIQTLPEDPYASLDLQGWLKYLYFGSQRRDAQNNPITDSTAVLRFLGVTNAATRPEDYGSYLQQMIHIRNDWIGHPTPAELQSLTILSLTAHRDTMLALLEPLCRKNWAEKGTSQALFNRILQTFYAQLGPVQYSVASIMRFAHLDSTEQSAVESLLTAAGLPLAGGKVTLTMDPTDFADELALVWKRTGISPESRAIQLKLRLPGNESMSSDLLRTRTDYLRTVSQQALEELLAAAAPDAQYEMGWRCTEKSSGDRMENYKEAAAWFEKAADQGHAAAQRVLGRWLMQGRVIKRDREKGRLFLQMAVENGDSRAHFFLGEVFEKGQGVSPKAERAFALYEAGAQLKDKDCLLARARCLLEGIGTQQDTDTALFELQKLERQGNPDAVWQLGSYYQSSAPKRALEYFKKAADLGCTKALYDIGLFYQEGKVLPKDTHCAAACFQKAAEEGDPRAQYWLGCGYRDGTNGAAPDDTLAFRWFLRAAKQHYKESYYDLARCFLDGKGVETDRPHGEQIMEHAAALGDPRAQYALAERYLKSWASREMGVALLEKAASQGYVAAALRLGDHYGEFSSLDEEKMFTWYKTAGDMGVSEGYYRIAVYYEDNASLQKSFPWYIKAAEAGHIQARITLAKHLLYGRCDMDIPPYPTKEDAIYCLLEEAAIKGNAEAAHQMGICCEKGIAMPKDKEAAIRWYFIALQDEKYPYWGEVRSRLQALQ